MTLTDYLLNPPQEAHYLLLGNPVTHSVSPQIHQPSLHEVGLPGLYFAVQVLPEEMVRIPELISNRSLLGVNITIPYKEKIASYVSEMEPEAVESGAINTLYRKGDRWIGTNTDIHGVLEALSIWKNELEDRQVILFGSGGAAKAAILALRRLKLKKILVVTRDLSKKEAFSAFEDVDLISYEDWESYAPATTLFVNSTPLGLWPHSGGSPISKSQAALLTGKLCFDMVYRPLKTLFLQRAESVGAQTIDGLTMLLHQANTAFHYWTGHTFSIEKRRKELIPNVDPTPDFQSFEFSSSIKAIFTHRNPSLIQDEGVLGLDYGVKTQSSQNAKEYAWNLLQNQVSWTVHRAWLEQVHSGEVRITNTSGLIGQADGLVTTKKGLALTIQVADCIPVLFADGKHQIIGAAHAGWRGVVAGIVPNTIKAMIQLGAYPEHIQVWIGPGISLRHFEVGEEVASQFSSERVDRSREKPHVDLQAVVRDQLESEGILSSQIQTAQGCSFGDSLLFHSYRRDKEQSGRMVAMISLTEPVCE